MGKKKKKGSAKQTRGSKKPAPKSKKRSKSPFIVLAFGVALVIVGGYFLLQGKEHKNPTPEPAKVKKANIKLRETKPTLSPERFKGRVRRAYQIAREIPEVLDRLYCYCRCRENVGHKNLLSCYTDTHAST